MTKRLVGGAARSATRPRFADNCCLARLSDLLPLFGPVAIGTAVLIALRWRMNVMSLPEEEARSLGVATGPLRIAIVRSDRHDEICPQSVVVFGGCRLLGRET